MKRREGVPAAGEARGTAGKRTRMPKEKSRLVREFREQVETMLRKIEATQYGNMERASRMVADTVKNDGIVYVFGTGHSHLIAEEVTYRAGGLAPIDAILEPSLTGHSDVVKSEQLERLDGFGRKIIEHRRLKPTDVLFVISNSGRNTVPIEAALAAKERGARTIAVTSLEYSKHVSSRHPSGQRLYEVAELTIDNGGVVGDAVLRPEGVGRPMGPTSGLGGVFVMHAVLARAAELLAAAGIEPPVFVSGNLDGAEEHNQEVLERYWGRVRIW